MDHIFEISVWLLDSGNAFLRFLGKLLYKIPRAYTKSLEKTRKGENDRDPRGFGNETVKKEYTIIGISASCGWRASACGWSDRGSASWDTRACSS